MCYNTSMNIKKHGKKLLLVFTVLFCFSPVYGADAQRSAFEVNLIIDGSRAFSVEKEEITTWILSRLDQIMAEGDRVTVWNAGTAAKVVYSGRISSNADKDAVKKSIRDFSVSGDSADFTGALTEASRQQGTGIIYTLLISVAPDPLSSLLSGPQANLLRYSRVEEFSGWRALVVGMNIDSKVKKAADDFTGS